MKTILEDIINIIEESDKLENISSITRKLRQRKHLVHRLAITGYLQAMTDITKKYNIKYNNKKLIRIDLPPSVYYTFNEEIGKELGTNSESEGE